MVLRVSNTESSGTAVSDEQTADSAESAGAKKPPKMAAKRSSSKKLAPKRRRSGSKRQPARREQPASKNAAHAAFGDEVAAADAAVSALDEKASRELARTDRLLSGATGTAVQCIYGAVVALEARGAVEAFLAARNIQVHGNVKNFMSPLLKGFIQRRHRHLRATLSKYAEVLALAREERIAPAAFERWRRDWPLERACQEWRQRHGKALEDEEQLIASIVEDPAKRPEIAILLPPTPLTRGHVGRRLAILDVAEDGTGGYQMVGICPCIDGALRQVILSVARKHKRRSSVSEDKAA